MAHTHDRNLVQSLGIEKDHKSPDHDLAVLYLQANAQRLAEKVITIPKEQEGSMTLMASDMTQILTPHKVCDYCEIKTPREFYVGGYQKAQLVRYTSKPVSVKLKNTALERQVSKGEGKFQTLIGFIDLVIFVRFSGIKTYLPADYRFVRSCANRDHNSDLPIHYQGRQHNDVDLQIGSSVGIEVKTCPVPLGDAIRQISLYKEYTTCGTWVFATTVPLDTAYRDALEHENIRTLLIGSEYKQAKQTLAAMDTI